MAIDPEKFLNELFGVAVEAVSADRCLASYLPSPPKGKTLVIGAGKAAASMAKAVEENWHGPLSGLVITRYGHGLALDDIELVEAGHPVPDEAGAAAADDIISRLAGLSEDDLVLCLISGGGSSLLAKPASGISLNDKKQINKALLRSGATISEMNTVRKKLSAVKGGRLAIAAYPAKVVTLLISDVPGDDPSVIASGPTIADHSTLDDARKILAKYTISLPAAVDHLFQNGDTDTPDPEHPVFKNSVIDIIAKPQDALQAAANFAREQGIEPMILGDSIEGEAKDVALVHAGIARQVLLHNEPIKAPCVILSGGETTVTVSNDLKNPGRGGRNAEFLLAFAKAMEGEPRVHAFAADTDGIDGTEDNAGALCGPTTLKRARAQSLDPSDYLQRHDAYSFFDALGDLVKTGPTRTNVNDFRAILILPE
ncbi:MAG: glycerate kinase [Sneathiella sp.]